MEIDYNNAGSTKKSINETEYEKGLIRVKATLSCHSCGYTKTFKNQFHKKNIEQMVVSLKCFDYMTCTCGELLNLDLNFEL